MTAMKQQRRDPDYREKMSVYFAMRRQDAVKAWTRRGVPNGFSGDQADQTWHDGRAKAAESRQRLGDQRGRILCTLALASLCKRLSCSCAVR
jgi:hypothetical protein